MKKATIIASVVAAVFCSCLISSVAFADCGKMMIYPYHGWRTPRPQPKMPYIVAGRDVNINVNVTINNYAPPKLGKKCPDKNYQPYECEIDRFVPPQPKPTRQELDILANSGWNQAIQTNPIQSPQPVQSPSGVANSTVSDNDGSVNIIHNADDNDPSTFYGTFEEANQRAVIAWNGFDDERGEETLILTTEEQSATGESMPMLSVLPLPGRALEIKEADTEVFNNTQKLLYKKLKEAGASVGFGGVDLERKIGCHNIFVWKLDNITTFKDEVTAYIRMKFEDKAAALIDERTEKIVGEYFKRGYRYFAFDLTEVNKDATNKVAISYRFKSKFVYFPLQISGVGGTASHTVVDLIVITPDLIQLSGVVKVGVGEYPAAITGKASVEFTNDEVAGLNEELALVFGNQRVVRAREYVFEGTLNAFKGDFTARAIPRR